jgi:hypothetical protein
MSSRAEITTKYAKAYKGASKKDRGRLLDEVVAVTGWSRSRDNARRRLTAAAKPPETGSARRRLSRPRCKIYLDAHTMDPRRRASQLTQRLQRSIPSHLRRRHPGSLLELSEPRAFATTTAGLANAAEPRIFAAAAGVTV